MKVRTNWIILGFATCLQSQALARVGEEFESTRFQEVQSFVEEKMRGVGRGDVLVVLDIDNTTIRPHSDLGSEHWFIWQKELLDHAPQSGDLVGSNLQDLLVRQSWIQIVGGTVPVDRLIPGALRGFGTAGAALMALSSRSPQNRDFTIDQFRSTSIPIPEFAYAKFKNIGLHFPYELAHPQRTGLTKADMELVNHKESRPVVYDNGVYLTDGQHKGVMLKALLWKLKWSPRVIIFIDDRAHHLKNMRAAFATATSEIHTIRYTRMLSQIEEFQRSSKSQVIKQWQDFQFGVCLSLPAAMPDLCQSNQR